MKTKASIGIGDAIEVRVLTRPKFIVKPITAKPNHKQEIMEEWIPATVCHLSVSGNEIGAAFSDGERIMLSRYSQNWRIP